MNMPLSSPKSHRDDCSDSYDQSSEGAQFYLSNSGDGDLTQSQQLIRQRPSQQLSIQSNNKGFQNHTLSQQSQSDDMQFEYASSMKNKTIVSGKESLKTNPK